MEIFLHADTWVAFLTLTFLEIVLGIDNIIFISIATSKLPEHQQKKAQRIGLILAMIMRIILLIGVSYLIAMNRPFFTIDLSWISSEITGQSIIMYLGGLFLLYKSTKEIRHKVEGEVDDNGNKTKIVKTISAVIIQIILIDIVFSFDSVLTAVGMTNGINGALLIMILAVIISIIIMILFCKSGKQICEHPPYYSNVGFVFLNFNWVYVDNRRCSFIKYRNFRQRSGRHTKRLFVFRYCFFFGS